MMFLKFDINHQLIKKSNEIRLLVLHSYLGNNLPNHLQVVSRHYHGDGCKLLSFHCRGSTMVENQVYLKKDRISDICDLR